MMRALGGTLAILCAAFAPGDEPTRAARSVHLSYVAPTQGDGYLAFYNECIVEQSTPGSYFQACGFHGGYFGIQELADGRKVAIFSVWDPTTGDDPHAVEEKDRVEMPFVGDDVRAQRFGGEGTGAQSFFDYDWKIGTPVRFYIEADVQENKTAYSAFIQLPDGNTWKQLATFRTRCGKGMGGLYAFIEDFRRDTTSATEIRRAMFSHTSVRDAAGQWHPVRQARFTASSANWEAKDSIDAGVLDADSFYLQTGGGTRSSSPLGTTLSLKEK